jgi:RNA polymerase sigma factor (sigma-70 family)
MATRSEHLLRQLRQVASGPASDSGSDGALLARFVQRRDQGAFASLVARYGPLVLGVCRRVLRDAHEAEDVAQATFLILARKAAAIRRPEALAAWLHGTARRLALRCRRGEVRRRKREAESLQTTPKRAPPHPLDEITARELLLILDEEVQRLPETYRLPVLLCCLEGRSQEEASRQLGWTAGSVKGRLERGRARLHARLARRGLMLTAVFAAAEISRTAASGATLPTGAIARAALAFATGAGGPSASAEARRLAECALRQALVARFGMVAVLLLGAGLAVAAAGALARTTSEIARPEDQAPPAAAQPRPKQAPQGRTDLYADPLPPGAVARLGTVRFRLGGLVYACAYAPDGKTVAVGCADGAIAIFDAATGKQVRQLQGSHFHVTSLAYASDGRTLASGGGDQTIHIWDLATGKSRQLFRAPAGPVWSLAFSRDGKSLVSAGQDALVYLWDPETGRELRRFTGHQNSVRCAALSPDGRTLASGGGAIRLWDVTTGKMLRRLTGPEEMVRCLAFSPDSKLLAAGGKDGAVWLYDPSSGTQTGTLTGGPPQGYGVRSLTFSPDGKRLAAGSATYALRLWEPSTQKKLWERPGGNSVTYTSWHDGGVQSVAFSPDGRRLIVAEDNRLALFDPQAGKEVVEWAGHRGVVQQVCFSPDGTRLLATSDDPLWRILEWDAGSGRVLRRVPGKALWARLTAFSSDRKILVATAHGSALHLWDTTTGGELRQIPIPLKDSSQSPGNLAYQPGGKLLAVAAAEGEAVWLFDAATGQQVCTVEGMGQRDRVASLAFSPDGRLLAAAAQKTIELAEVPSGRRIRHIVLPKEHTAVAAALSPDGRTLAVPCSALFEGTSIKLYETASGKERLSFRGPRSQVFRVAFSPDGRLLATAGMEHVVSVWDAVTGKQVGRLEGHRGNVEALAFSPDGRRLASGSQDTTILIWDVTRLAADAPGPVPPVKNLEAQWSSLAGADAVEAYRAILALASVPDQTVPLLAERLRPRPAPVAERIAHLLVQLESNRFAERERASEDLRQVGWEAEPAVCQFLAGKPSLEARKRAEDLLIDIRKKDLSPDLLQRVRGLEVLERIGSREARQVLQGLAGGTPDALLTREAHAALDRLAHSAR